jgi:hypothetical protein
VVVIRWGKTKYPKGAYPLKKRIQLVLVIMLFITGGCGMSKEKENGKIDASSMPETEAFQDEFTRDFMASSEEVEEGYYTFESKTKGYTMKFPKNAILDEMFYEREKDYFETVNFGETNESSNISYYVVATYENQPVTKEVDANLSLLSESVKYEGEYSIEELKDRTIYFGKKEHKPENEDSATHIFFGYVVSKESDKAVSFIHNVMCLKTEEKCAINSVSEEAKTIEFMKSIYFLD